MTAVDDDQRGDGCEKENERRQLATAWSEFGGYG